MIIDWAKQLQQKNGKRLTKITYELTYNCPKFHPKNTNINNIKKLKLPKNTFDRPYLTMIGQLLP